MVSSHSADELHSMLDPLLIETTQPLSALSSLSRELILDSVPLILARIRLALLDPWPARPRRIPMIQPGRAPDALPVEGQECSR